MKRLLTNIEVNRLYIHDSNLSNMIEINEITIEDYVNYNNENKYRLIVKSPTEFIIKTITQDDIVIDFKRLDIDMTIPDLSLNSLSINTFRYFINIGKWIIGICKASIGEIPYVPDLIKVESLTGRQDISFDVIRVSDKEHLIMQDKHSSLVQQGEYIKGIDIIERIYPNMKIIKNDKGLEVINTESNDLLFKLNVTTDIDLILDKKWLPSEVDLILATFKNIEEVIDNMI